MAEDPDDSVFLRRDYSGLWQPPPRPPGRLPWGLLLVVAGVFLGALLLAAVGD